MITVRVKKEIAQIVLLLFLIPSIGGCETLYTGKGYVVHDDTQAMDFAWTWFNEKDYDTAERTVNAALSVNSENIDAYNLLGIIALRKGNPKVGIEHFKKAEYLVKKYNASHKEYIIAVQIS